VAAIFLRVHQSWVLVSFQSRNEIFFYKIKEIKGLRRGVHLVRRTCLRAPHRQASDPAD